MKLNYRPEIDGLRAIAVVAVILYHAQITIFGYQPFKGGFIGVDIFFVISGYLITSIILKELITTGSFSFKHFYERRVRRILPALLFVMLVSLPFAWMYILPGSFIDFSNSILYSLGFSSNFYFHYSGQVYGATDGFLKPFLHTWSLSVEEQFYILFPIILLIIFRYFKKYLIHILILGIFISLGLADWGSRNYPSFNFYVLPTRGWEVLAGSILAYFEITLGHRSNHQKLNLIMPSLGLLLIIHSILFFHDEMFHPSLYTLSPIVGVCLIIWFSSKNELTTKVISTKLFLGIGLISYSLYLWHYPIFVFSKITELTQGSIFKKLLIGITILILSILTYYFVERPSRNKKNKFKLIFSLIILSMSILITYNFNVIWKDGYKIRGPEILSKNLVEQPWAMLKNSQEKICYDNIDGCKFNKSSNKKIYIIGDSHIGSLIFDLKDKVIKKDYQFNISTFGGCLYYPDFNLVEVKSMKVSERCNNRYFQKLKETLSKEKNSIIIFGGRFPLHISNHFFNNKKDSLGKEWHKKFVALGQYDTIEESFKTEILKLSKNNKIILIYPIPEVGWNPNQKILSQWTKRNKFSKNFILENKTTNYEVYKDRTKSSFELLNSIKGKNIYKIYPHELFCDTIIKNRCITHDDKNIFYSDKNHPSIKGAEMINGLIMREIEKIESR